MGRPSLHSLLAEQVGEVEEIVRDQEKLWTQPIVPEERHEDVFSQALHLFDQRDVVPIPSHEDAHLVVPLVRVSEDVRCQT